MLSTNSTSSIQRRRQLHRRQNSLEVPILVAPLPAPHRRPNGHHRRGLSLDQSSTNFHPGHRPLTPLQEQEPSMVSIATNQGRPQSQHSMQAQQHRPAQPGFPMDPHQFSPYHHPRQFYPSNFPQPQEQAVVQEVAPREQALQNLNAHIQTFMQQFGPVFDDSNMPQQQPQAQPQLVHLPHSSSAQRPVTPANTYMPQHPCTTPQRRSERPMLDVAPMPATFANVPILQIQESPSREPAHLLQESFGSDYGYASSYASSMVDPSSPMRSPVRHNSTAGMPTLYENISPVSIQSQFGQEHSLLTATTTTPDLRYMTESPMLGAPMSPREMMLSNLDIDATIEDTGISAEEVQQYISDQSLNDQKWTCLFDGCFKKFGRKENIKSHVQTHLGDRQFRCNHCGKCFVRQHDLKRHAKIHSGDKPHKCPCGNGFARQDALTRHRQRGVCEGAFPGLERREQKRGRPRKARPDMVDRLDKAERSRQLNARRGSEASAYDSSSSPSDRSYPDTPQEFEDGRFVDFNGTNSTNLNAFIKAYEETPPTSPTAGLASLPTKQTNGVDASEQWYLEDDQEETDRTATHFATPPRSSPPPMAKSPELVGQSSSDAFAGGIFDFGPLDAQPKVSAPSNMIFSPAMSSSQGSEFDHQSPEVNTGAETFMGAEAILDFNNSMYGATDALFQASMDAWDFDQ